MMQIIFEKKILRKKMVQHANLKKVWDEKARNYDAEFGTDLVSKYIRDFNLNILLKYIESNRNSRILDLGCGTGEDAIFLGKKGYNVSAIDISPKMIQIAKLKAKREELQDKISFKIMPIEKIGELAPKKFDVIYSSFGPLNCIINLPKVVEIIGNLLSESGFFISTMINKFCISEFMYYALKGKMKNATRRWHENPVQVTLKSDLPKIWCNFYTPRQYFNFGKDVFHHIETIGLPIIIFPVNYGSANDYSDKILKKIIKVEKKIAGLRPFNKFGDHYITVLQKR
jgi:ubiquinone/menaquinone biosynthesis C-methylase UbiE